MIQVDWSECDKMYIRNCVLFPHWVLRPFWKWLFIRLKWATGYHKPYHYHIMSLYR
jgi:hypothetical protein